MSGDIETRDIEKRRCGFTNAISMSQVSCPPGKSQVSSLRSHMSPCKSQVSGLWSHMSPCKSQVSGLRSHMSPCKSQVSGLWSLHPHSSGGSGKSAASPMVSLPVLCGKAASALLQGRGSPCHIGLASIEAAMKCSDSFLVGRVIPNAPRRLGDKPPYHRGHNISLPEL